MESAEIRWFESCRGKKMKAKRAVRTCCAIGVLALMSGAVISSPNFLLAAGPSSTPTTATLSAGPSSVPATAASSAGLPADVQAELRSLAPGTVIVPCNSSVSVLPEGVQPDTTLGFSFAHPGFRYLSHGYCADNPNATPIPVVVPIVDGPPGSTLIVAP
jgi:hypothetical protein